jgi:hypothetical protein
MALYDADIIMKMTGAIIGMNLISGWKMHRDITRTIGSRSQEVNCGSWLEVGEEDRGREAGDEINQGVHWDLALPEQWRDGEMEIR